MIKRYMHNRERHFAIEFQRREDIRHWMSDEKNETSIREDLLKKAPSDKVRRRFFDQYLLG